MTGIGSRKSYHEYNSRLNLAGANGQLQLEADKEALNAYLAEEIKPRTKHVGNNYPEKLDWLLRNNYYSEKELTKSLSFSEVIDVFEFAEELGHKFESFVGAFKFYGQYALKTRDGKEYLENFAERAAATGCVLGKDVAEAIDITREIIEGAYQPATPTFLNAGRVARGEYVSCQLLRIEDNLESVSRAITSALQLSKRGGGVSLLGTNIREAGAPIKENEGLASGIIPVMKLLEDSFSYANQLGSRAGAGAIYVSAHHPDILAVLDTKRENADEKIRIKTLSVGVVIPDVTLKLAQENKEMHLFSPYDIQKEYGKAMSDISITEMYDELVANPRISKRTINAREFFKTLAELQFESGYPYIMFEDNVNKVHNLPHHINMSNLCSEITQMNTPSTFNENGSYAEIGQDISCNLGSMNVYKAVTTNTPFGEVVRVAINALTSVSDQSNFECVPSIKKANENTHSIGLGQMNLHGALAAFGMEYGSEEALDFTNMYFYTVAFHAYSTSCTIAQQTGVKFSEFDNSKYADGSAFTKYIEGDWTPKTDKVRELFYEHGIAIPTQDDWRLLAHSVKEHGLYHAYLMTVPPTGSISYINHSTSSIHPIAAPIEIRKEGKMGRVYYPAPHMTNENKHLFKSAYEIGYEALIDTYAVAQQHIDQALSCTLFFKDTATTRDINKAQIYAWRKGIKTLYYIRLRQAAMEGTEVADCVSCQL